LDFVHYFPDKTSEQLELPPLSTRRKIAPITLLHKAIHEKVAIPLNGLFFSLLKVVVIPVVRWFYRENNEQSPRHFTQKKLK
jgi:hypothetical protein